MILYPAIDLKNGECVRLKRGALDDATVYSSHPAEQAQFFERSGFEWLHIVDLNGAFEGEAVNIGSVRSILRSVNIPIQLGGGIRTLEDITRWLEAGVKRVILGTAALRFPELVKTACKEFPGSIAVGIDAKGGKVAIEGWAEISETSAISLAKSYEDCGVCAIIYTDIDRDGVMEGPNIEATAALADQLSTPVILSGGIASLADIQNIKKREAAGIEGVILGRALYEQAISPKEALAIA